MNSTVKIISAFLTIISIVRMGLCMMKQSVPQKKMDTHNIYSQERGSYEYRYAQWEKEYGKSYVESLSEEKRAVFLKDVNCLTKTTDEMATFSPTTPWDSLKNEYLVIHYPKDWAVTTAQNASIHYIFQPINAKINKDNKHQFHVELVGISSAKRLMEGTDIEKEKIFPVVANVWWQQQAHDGYDIRGIEKIKFLGFDAYYASGQLAVGEDRLSSLFYLISTPQGIYQFTIVGNPDNMVQYVQTATHIIQTLMPLKEI